MAAIKDYIKHFKILFIFFGVILALWGLKLITFFFQVQANSYESTNTQRLTTERVFDYAEVLTDKEEDKLRKLIAKREMQTGCDIVIVTLNQSLADYELEYRAKYDYNITGYEYVMVFSDKFWEDNKFGYDKPLSDSGLPDSGDGVILVDNIYDEYIPEYHEYSKCTWLGTQGKVERKYSDAMIDHLLDVVYEDIDRNPYKAYKKYVNTFTYDMMGGNLFAMSQKNTIPFIAMVIALFAYIPAKLVAPKGKKTTTAQTYLVGKRAEFPVKQDIFLRKNVTRSVHVESSGGGGGGGRSGGGGHHSSGGGHSHGGGGHHR